MRRGVEIMRQYINSNQLRHRITLQQPNNTPDGAGGFTKSWTNVADHWASVIPMSGNETLEDDQIKGKIKYEVTLRYREGVNSEMRFLYDGKVLEIESVVDVEGRVKWLRCVCEGE